ncbi:hypothetical protein H6F51_18190 [Cyanobacteria bacterium FACHB-DQ100]|nr:hypothetical protein [Cyanobacteria bacterium FACHB-DQ100]
MPSFEELNAETKVQIAKAIFIFESIGKLNTVERKFEIDADTVQQIKKQAEQALTTAFADLEDQPLIIDPDLIFAYIEGKPEPEATEPTQDEEPKRTRKKYPDLTDEQKKQLKIILQKIRDYNKKHPNTPVKASEGILQAGLEHYEMSAPVVITKLNQTNDADLLKEIEEIDAATESVYQKKGSKSPVGKNAGKLVTDFVKYLTTDKEKPASK